METLREEFLCATYGRLVNIQVKRLLSAQHVLMAREDEISGHDVIEQQEKEYGLRTFIPASMTDLMRKLFVMKILVGKFLVLIRWHRKFFKDLRK
jgi:hypothetical protein